VAAHALAAQGFTKLLVLEFSIRYKQGATNRAADALSCRPEPEASLCAISQLHPAWMLDIIAAYNGDQQALELLTRLSVKPDGDAVFSLRDGVIRYKNRVWLPFTCSLPALRVSSHSASHQGFVLLD
jgi:hypothetical protein